jgi:hypothetical protein
VDQHGSPAAGEQLVVVQPAPRAERRQTGDSGVEFGHGVGVPGQHPVLVTDILDRGDHPRWHRTELFVAAALSTVGGTTVIARVNTGSPGFIRTEGAAGLIDRIATGGRMPHEEALPVPRGQPT